MPGEGMAAAQPPQASWLTFAEAYFVRTLGRFAFWLHRLANAPARTPTRTIWLDSLLAKSHDRGPRKLRVDLYEPREARGDKPRPAVFNFHGGGFVLGSSTDDSPWCTRVADELGAAVFSVDYRLGPDCVFPTNIDDCVDAILQICAQAEHYNIDPGRVFLSGFSAGGTQALASWVILDDPAQSNYTFVPPPSLRIAGLVLFYPLLDWSVSRDEKRKTAPDPNRTLPPWMTRLFHAAYASSVTDKTDPRASPGLMKDAAVKRLPPTHLCICEYDMLRREAEVLRDRAQAQGADVSWRLVEDEEHGFDKPPRLTQKPVVATEYAHAISMMRRCLD